MAEWWRSWHGGPTDAKWLVIARKAGVIPGTVSAIAWALFDHASQCEDRGDVSTFDVETYAAFSGYEEAEIDKVLSVMGDKNVIENGRLANWEKRQPKREDNSAERAKEWRERKRTQTNANEHRTEKNREEQNREEQKTPDKMTVTELRERVLKLSGQLTIGGGQFQILQEISRKYNRQRIEDALNDAAAVNPDNFIAYFRKVVNNEKNEKTGTNWEEVWDGFDGFQKG